MPRLFEQSKDQKLENLFNAACSGEDLDVSDFILIFSYKLEVPKSVFEQSEILENFVLQNILQKEQCPSVPSDIDVTGNANWLVSSHSGIHNNLTIRFPSLSAEQRQEIADAYNRHYGTIAITYEQFYGTNGYCKDDIGGILFLKNKFCSVILTDLIELQKQEKLSPTM